jgi:hypothetical protein
VAGAVVRDTSEDGATIDLLVGSEIPPDARSAGDPHKSVSQQRNRKPMPRASQGFGSCAILGPPFLQMAKISDLKPAYQIFTMAYPYRRVYWRPGAGLGKPLREARVAAVTTTAFFRPGQPPFDTSIRGGDYSYRMIPSDIDLGTLRIAHSSDAFDIHGSCLTGFWLCCWIGCIPWRGRPWLGCAASFQFHELDRRSRPANRQHCSGGCSNAAGR